MTAANLMFLLVKSEITNTQPDNINIGSFSFEVLKELYKLSLSHDISHIVASALHKQGLLGDDEISKKFKIAMFMTAKRHEKQNYELNRVSALFEENNIDFVLLKGAVIREFYPEPWLRNSCDIDILVKEQDIEKATELLCNKFNFTYQALTDHDISFFTPSDVHIELHYSLIEKEDNESVFKVTSQIWDYCNLKENCKHTFIMTAEMLYFYHIAHMQKHFRYGGCGVKPFIDLHLLSENLHFDAKIFDELCSLSGLTKFYNNMIKLTNIWFGDLKHTDTTKTTENYILAGGVYGSLYNRFLSRRGGKIRLTFYRIFLPYSELKLRYPILRKKKCLTPILEVWRWIEYFFNGGIERSANQLNIINDITNDDTKNIKKLFDELGL